MNEWMTDWLTDWMNECEFNGGLIFILKASEPAQPNKTPPLKCAASWF